MYRSLFSLVTVLALGTRLATLTFLALFKGSFLELGTKEEVPLGKTGRREGKRVTERDERDFFFLFSYTGESQF